MAAKGRTIIGNNVRSLVVSAGASGLYKSFNKFLNTRVKDLISQGRYANAHNAVAQIMNHAGSITLGALSTGYYVKQQLNNKNLRNYYDTKASGNSTLIGFMLPRKRRSNPPPIIRGQRRNTRCITMA